MKFDLIEKLLISRLNKVNKNDYRYNFYKTQIKELKEYKVEIYGFKKIKKLLEVYKNKDVIDLCFDYLDEYLIYGSYIHGINHNLRVLVHSIILSSLLGLERDSLKIIVYAAMYHDIGRVNDTEDKSHGKRSADKISELKLDLTEEQKNILRAIVQSHSLPDNQFENICKEYDIKNIKLCRILFNILKDSDALDRVRLEYPYIKLDFLRINYSLSLVEFAYELCYNFDRINEVILWN